MLITILAVLAATQSAPAAADQATAQPAAVAAKPAKPPKAKRKRHPDCGNDSPSLGSHIIMDTCPSDQDQEDATRQGLMNLRQGSYAEPGPH